ncbi:diguanylate cyclase [Vibrio sp. 16]|uniref:sensor domain-containing diguanylate cyclase n=1 Tax=Vibrio sp. 16 TaxID=391586 RepID=UPI0005C45B7E|nr:diguanylate cyclase [Vibrio sp. 16]
MQISNFSIKQLTVIASIMMAVTFVLFYLTFRYFWTYDTAVELAIERQNEEVRRVKTLIHLQKNDLAKSISDYAAWDEVVDFIEGNNDDLLVDSINEHSFSALQINGVFIFDADVSLMWGRMYDYIYKQELSYDEIRYKFGALLAESLRSRTDRITPFVRFLVLNEQPHLLATSRVCNSDAIDCDKGYMMILKPVGETFSRTLQQATGLQVHIKTKRDDDTILDHAQDNISIIEKNDYRNDETVFLEIHHSVKLPPFITWGELSAVLAFAVFMFAFNLSVVHIMVRPIKRARSALDQLMSGESSQLTQQDTFISYEMRDFVYRVNEVISQLESKQQELEWIAHHDALTKVGNRRSLQQHWQTLVEKQPKHTSLLLIDIDFFKPFNDHYGHVEGDNVLQQVATALKEAPTESSKFVARFGGEEFCVVLSNDSPLNNRQEAEWLRAAVETLKIRHHYSPIAAHLTASIGVADCGLQPLGDLQDLFLVADRALYEAKDAGRNQVVIHFSER